MLVERLDLTPDETALEGEVGFSQGQRVSNGLVTVARPPFPTVAIAADGTFSTPGFPYGPTAQVPVLARATTAFGTVRGADWEWTYPGVVATSTWVQLEHACPAGFATGLFPANDLNGEVRALAVFDDGSGPALVAGGTFTTARGITVNRVAKWNGSTWQALGSGLTASSSPSVDALAVFDDGSGPRLYAGGKFTNSGSATVRYVAKWTGTNWVQVGGNLGNQVLALAVHDAGAGPVLYAGGLFTSSGGTTLNRIARLSGSNWAAVGTGLNGTVRALASFDAGSGAYLVAGGSFTTAGGVAANRIARWNGSAWSALGTGVTGGSTIQVNSLRVHADGTGTALYAGGRFTTAGGLPSNHVARWDGSTWSPLGDGLGSSVNALGSFDDGRGLALFAAGSFVSVGGRRSTASRAGMARAGRKSMPGSGGPPSPPPPEGSAA